MPTGRDEQNEDAAYAGRWVAKLQGRVVGHGGTPSAAKRAAQASRHKEEPQISYIKSDSLHVFSALVDRVAQVVAEEEVFLVGGAVRDGLLGRASHDFDFCVRANAVKMARRVADALVADFYVLDAALGSARVILPNPAGQRDVLDFSVFRGPDLEADLAGRDFTINAMAFDLRNQTILDPRNGGSDLRTRTIRACSATAMQDDPIRILRAVRLAAALDFKIDPGTRRGMKAATELLAATTPERQRDELFRILDGPRADASLRALEMLNVFPHILPELVALKGVTQPDPHVYDVWEHTLAVIRHLQEIISVLSDDAEEVGEGRGLLSGVLAVRLGRYRRQLEGHLARGLNPDRTIRGLLFFAALYHDVSKPVTKSVDAGGRIHFYDHERQGAIVAAERARAFNLSSIEVARIETLVEKHMRFPSLAGRMDAEDQRPSRRAIFHFFREAGEAGVDLILLGLADLRGSRDHALGEKTWAAFVEVGRILLENYWDKPEEAVAPPRLLNGLEVMRAYGLKQGPSVGALLSAIREAQAAGRITTRQEALEFGRQWLAERSE
jgi:tRNA nucleotidyltransferase/poly(A) polymerase